MHLSQRLRSFLGVPIRPSSLRAVLGMAMLLPGLAMASASVNHKFIAEGVTPATSTILQGDVAIYTIEIVNDSVTSALTMARPASPIATQRGCRANATSCPVVTSSSSWAP